MVRNFFFDFFNFLVVIRFFLTTFFNGNFYFSSLPRLVKSLETVFNVSISSLSTSDLRLFKLAF